MDGMPIAFEVSGMPAEIERGGMA